MIGSGGRRVAGWAALAAGLCASAAGVVLAVQSARPPADVGAIPAPTRPAAAAGTPAGGTPAGGTAANGTAASGTPATGRPAAGTPAAGTASGRPDVPVSGGSAPTRITIGALHVDAPIDAVGVRGGELAVPDDPVRLGWWIGSATPGSATGTVLLAGHVDTADQGAGSLFGLERMPMGTTIDVRAAGRTVTYRAVARRSYGKQHLPAELFRTGTPPRLALVTCGGTFHDGSYSHNVVVYAEPVAAATDRPAVSR